MLQAVQGGSSSEPSMSLCARLCLLVSVGIFVGLDVSVCLCVCLCAYECVYVNTHLHRPTGWVDVSIPVYRGRASRNHMIQYRCLFPDGMY